MKLFGIKWIITFYVVIFLFSCESKNENKSVVNIIDSNEISFKRDIQPLFVEDCSECHDYLSGNNAYKMLTTQKSSCKDSPNYIDTLNPKSSYLYVKLHDVPVSGITMKGDHWTSENIEKLLKWIEQGAKNN